ncbi:MAG: AAA family ATPase, partial [Gammaproteobacteria bacterium]|nr:AAA family ATPase [Gammaproteobacteria bacterium]
MLEKIKFEKFTAFDRLDINLSPGVNIFLGENGTGKTHILKAAYAACDIAKNKGGFAEKINNVFYPSGKQIGRLVKRSPVSSKGSLEVVRRLAGGKEAVLRLSMSNHTTKPDKAMVSGSTKAWIEHPM